VPEPLKPEARTVRCPRCQGPALFSPDNRWRPFCSERCRLADLGAWADERFRIPAKPPQDAEVLAPT
jgi:uncharacterized protein